MKKCVFFVTGMLLSFIVLRPQVNSIKPVKFGQSVPPVYLKQLAGDSAGINKLILLDFWATWCTACISKFPELDSLQRVFAKDLRIVLVNTTQTGDDQERVNAFFANRKQFSGFNLVSGDSVDALLFPHKLIPHYVWLSATGVFLGTSSSAAVNASTIRNILRGDLSALQIQSSTSPAPLPIFRSVLTGHTEGLPTTIRLFRDSVDTASVILKVSNSTIPLLYSYCFPGFLDYDKNRILYEVADRGRYFPLLETFDSWKYRNTYCYELQLPASRQHEWKTLMQIDLDRYFNLQLSAEHRLLNCLVIRPNGKVHFPAGDFSTSRDNLNDPNDSVKFIRAGPLSLLVNYLNREQPIPVIDESGYADRLSITLPTGFLEPGVLRKFLRTQGLDLVETERTLPVLVFREKCPQP